MSANVPSASEMEGEAGPSEGQASPWKAWGERIMWPLRRWPVLGDIGVRLAELDLYGLPAVDTHNALSLFNALCGLEIYGTTSGDITFVVTTLPYILEEVSRLRERRRQSAAASPLFPEARPTSVSASDVIAAWSRITEDYALNPKRLEESNYDGGVGHVARDQADYNGALGRRLQALGLLALEMELSLPAEVLALVSRADEKLAQSTDKDTPSTPDDVFAMATIRENLWLDDTGELEELARRQGLDFEFTMPVLEGGCVPVFEIGAVASRPSRTTGLGRELLLQIMRQAATSGHLVVVEPASARLMEYYLDMGFKTINQTKAVVEMGFPATYSSETVLVYSEPLPVVTDSEQLYELVSLSCT